MAKSANLKHPVLMTSTALRKYISTVAQIIHLEKGELEWLANHLGHDLEVHKSFYRLHESTVELSKVSRLLLAVDSGSTAKFSGKSLAKVHMMQPDDQNDAHDCDNGDDYEQDVEPDNNDRAETDDPDDTCDKSESSDLADSDANNADGSLAIPQLKSTASKRKLTLIVDDSDYEPNDLDNRRSIVNHKHRSRVSAVSERKKTRLLEDKRDKSESSDLADSEANNADGSLAIPQLKSKHRTKGPPAVGLKHLKATTQQSSSSSLQRYLLSSKLTETLFKFVGVFFT